MIEYINKIDNDGSQRLIRLLDKFNHHGHNCLVFELFQEGDLYSFMVRKQKEQI